MTETVMLPHHACRALLRAESFDPDDNTIEVVWSTGASVLRFDWDGPYTETLEMSARAVRLDRLNAGAPFLNTHSSYDLDDVLGRVVPGSAKLMGKEGVCRVKLSSDPDKAGIITDIRGGVIGNVSVGYIVHQMTRTEAQDGKTASCMVTDWEPIEISAVPIPADMNAAIRSEPAADKHPCLVTRATAPVPAIDPAVAARSAETVRVQGILKIARQLGLDDILADTAIADTTSLDAFRELAIDAQATRYAAERSVSTSAAASTSETPQAAVAAHTGEPAMTDRNHDAGIAADPSLDASRAASLPVTAPAPTIDVAAVRKAETDRIQGILVTARKLNLSADLADKAIADGVTLDGFRAVAIDAAASRQVDANFGAHVGASDPGHQHRAYAQPRVDLPKGTDATRCLMALAAMRGHRGDAVEFARKHWGTSGDTVVRALSTSIGTGGGFLVPPEMASEVIELLRPASTVMALGPTIIPMPAGNISIPRIAGGASANYAGENQVAPASQPNFGMVQLSAKKLITLVPISNDMLKFPSISTDGIVRDDMVRSIAMRADLAFLRGNGSQFSPRGFRSFAAATSLGGANVIAANPVVNVQNITNDLGKLELALENANIAMTKPGWVMSPRTKTYLMNLRDGLSNLIYAGEMAQGRLRGKPFKITTQIPNTLAGVAADGTTQTTDASEIYFADFAEVLIGEAYGLEIAVFDGGSYVDAGGTMQSGISNDQTVMRAIVQHDMNMRQEAAVAVLTGVRWFS